jgi:serine carboxypeptidase-like clade 2
LRRWTDSATTVLPILTELLNNDVRVWVYRYASTASLSAPLMQQLEIETY